VSKGAVYYHFANKAELFEAVFRARQMALTSAVAAATSQQRDPWDQLLAGLDAFLSGSVADPIHRSLLQQPTAASSTTRSICSPACCSAPCVKPRWSQAPIPTPPPQAHT
jgi:AcrR family transcriptional regulator